MICNRMEFKSSGCPIVIFYSYTAIFVITIGWVCNVSRIQNKDLISIKTVRVIPEFQPRIFIVFGGVASAFGYGIDLTV